MICLCWILAFELLDCAVFTAWTRLLTLYQDISCQSIKVSTRQLEGEKSRHTLIFLALQLKQPPRDFLCDRLVKFGAKVRCARTLGGAPSRSSEQSRSGECDEEDDAIEPTKVFITLWRCGWESCFVDSCYPSLRSQRMGIPSRAMRVGEEGQNRVRLNNATRSTTVRSHDNYSRPL